jgi:uncharacterized protein YndB with AHSA1/START domain
MSGKLIMREEGKNLIMEWSFDAPREEVFKAFSDSSKLESWWGPEGWETKNKKFDFKPGGVWHYGMTCKDKSQGDFYGMESWGIASYKEISAPEKIVHTDAFSDEEGNVNESLPETLITATFTEEEGKTKYVSITEFPSKATLRQIVDMGAAEGFASQLRKLDILLAGNKV